MNNYILSILICLFFIPMNTYAKVGSRQPKLIISHAAFKVKYEIELRKIKKRLADIEDTETRLHRQSLLASIETSKIGRFLIINKGLDALMTQYVVLYPKYKEAKKGTFPDDIKLTQFDIEFLETYPIVRATQERFILFQDLLHRFVGKETIVASLPCGLMDDLLTLQLPEGFKGQLVGIDADPLSIQKAYENASRLNMLDLCEFFISDCWNLNTPMTYDIITSNGLNIYAEDEDEVIELYRNLYDALNPEGILITSFLIPSPALNPNSEWDIKAIDMERAKVQKEFLVDVIGVHWAHYYTSEQTLAQLRKAGFKKFEIHWDSQKLFPAVIAFKTSYPRPSQPVPTPGA